MPAVPSTLSERSEPVSTPKTGVTKPASTPKTGVADVFFGVPESDPLTLPDLGHSRDITIDDVVTQNQPQDPALEAHSTEEELDAAGTLLSLSTVRDNLSLGLDEFDDNSLLMPIGGPPPIEDVAPEPLRLDQVDVDGEIA